MDAPQFALWLQGFAELSTEPPTKDQWQSIREHLQLVFTKVTPEVKRPAIDLAHNEELREMVERNRKEKFHVPLPSVYQPYFLGDQSGYTGPTC